MKEESRERQKKRDTDVLDRERVNTERRDRERETGSG